MESTDGVMVCAKHYVSSASNGLNRWCNGMCRALYIECSYLQPAAASKVATRLCWYSCLFPLAFESGSLMSDYLQAGVALLVFESILVPQIRPQYTHTHTHTHMNVCVYVYIYIYIYIYIYSVCVCVNSRVY